MHIWRGERIEGGGRGECFSIAVRETCSTDWGIIQSCKLPPVGVQGSPSPTQLWGSLPRYPASHYTLSVSQWPLTLVLSETHKYCSPHIASFQLQWHPHLYTVCVCVCVCAHTCVYMYIHWICSMVKIFRKHTCWYSHSTNSLFRCTST